MSPRAVDRRRAPLLRKALLVVIGWIGGTGIGSVTGVFLSLVLALVLNPGSILQPDAFHAPIDLLLFIGFAAGLIGGSAVGILISILFLLLPGRPAYWLYAAAGAMTIFTIAEWLIEKTIEQHEVERIHTEADLIAALTGMICGVAVGMLVERKR